MWNIVLSFMLGAFFDSKGGSRFKRTRHRFHGEKECAVSNIPEELLS